jgi:predicted nucleic acid-binding protein
MFLVDTNIISADAPTKRIAESRFIAWMQHMDARLYTSAVTIAEIERGITRLDRIEATAKADRLRTWLFAVERLYAGRILSFDVEAARHSGKIMDRSRGHAVGFADIAIASIAAANNMTVLTANTKDFGPLGVRFLNPFVDDLPV